MLFLVIYFAVLLAFIIIYRGNTDIRDYREIPEIGMLQDWKAKQNQKLAEENQKETYSDNLNASSLVYYDDPTDTYFGADDSGCNSTDDSLADNSCNSTGDSGDSCNSAGDSGCDSTGDSGCNSIDGFGGFGGW